MMRRFPVPPVEVEEIVTRYIPPNNGAGPLWCYGSPTILREDSTEAGHESPDAGT